MSANTVTNFFMGRLVGTPGALNALKASGEHPASYMARHAVCDWGELNEEDRQANDEAVLTGGRLLSSYLLKDGKQLWIITEANRSSTCLLLPSEY